MTTGKPMLILYGSRTGNAEFTAHGLATSAKDHQLLAQVVAMDAFDTEQLAEFERILIVCSTYGEGDMPDNAQGLWDKLDQPDAPQLGNSHYSVLAFGDSSYETFCKAGKLWDEKLEELGATRIAKRVDCDVDYLDATTDWIEKVLPIITAVGDQTELESSTAVLPTDARVKYNRNNPLKSKIVSKRLLTASTSSKETWHIELLLGDEEVRISAIVTGRFGHRDRFAPTLDTGGTVLLGLVTISQVFFFGVRAFNRSSSHRIAIEWQPV